MDANGRTLRSASKNSESSDIQNVEPNNKFIFTSDYSKQILEIISRAVNEAIRPLKDEILCLKEVILKLQNKEVPGATNVHQQYLKIPSTSEVVKQSTESPKISKNSL